MSIRDSVCDFLQSNSFDYAFDFAQNYFQIYQEILDLLNINEDNNKIILMLNIQLKLSLKSLEKLYIYQKERTSKF